MFVEPFAGGGIVGLTVAFEELAAHVTLVERDADVTAVWHTMLSDSASAFAQAITAFDLTTETVNAALALPPSTLTHLAFQTILRNRVNRGGILAPGVGRIKHGENGRGLRSRWYPETLARRIRAIAAIRERMAFVEGDGMAIMHTYVPHRNAVFFIDPPYTAAGKRAGSRLYRHSDLDHEGLFALAATLTGDFLITYDDTQEVHTLACHHGFDVQAVAMKNTHHAAMTELLIGHDLAWIRETERQDTIIFPSTLR